MASKNMLTDEELAALREYAAAVGPGWKKQLSRDWARAGSTQVPSHVYGVLHGLRNSRGPAWLATVALEKNDPAR